jgi:uncharacterized delta-60 repeat protein
MTFSLIFRKRLFILIFLSVFFGCFSISLKAQTLPDIDSQISGAVDPLFFNLRSKRNPNISPKNDFLTNKRENISPTAGELDTSLNPIVDSVPGSVSSSALQSDGKLIVGGYFKTLGGVLRKNLARLNSDNTIDSSFAPNVNGTVLAIAVQSDGKIIIGRLFTSVGGTNRGGIARLNSDGSLDSGFNAEIGGNGFIYDIAVQTDGKILIGGSFVPTILRLNADGSTDSTFTSPLNPSNVIIPSVVYSIGIQSNGKILIGGLLQVPSSFPNSLSTPILRLNTDGAIDNSFSSVTTNSNIFDLAVQPDDKIIIGGFFTTINDVTRLNIARLNMDGTLDTSFDAGANTSPIRTILLKSDGNILAGFQIGAGNGLALELTGSGSLVRRFLGNQVALGAVNTINQTANGKIFVGGSFFSIVNGLPNTGLVFNADGSLDSSVNLNSIALGGVRKIVSLPDGKMIVGGNFNRVNGVGRDRLVRLNANGTIDETFSSTSISAIEIDDIILQPDGKIIVGGVAVSARSGTLGSLVRLNPDGSVDNSFDTSNVAIRTVKKLALHSDGKILVSYSSDRPTTVFLGGGLLRLNQNGSRDETFTSEVNFPFEDIVVLPNNQILAGGVFGFRYVNSTTGESIPFNGVIRVNADGTHDRTFRPAFESVIGRSTSVYTIALQNDGRILVGGSLFVNGDIMPKGVARLDSNGSLDPVFQLNTISNSTGYDRIEDIKLLPNGKFFAAGLFSNFGANSFANIARLNANGTIDNSFSTGTNNIIYDVEVQTDGKVLIGGDFELVNGLARTSLARLLSEPISQRRAKFDFDGDNKTDVSIFRSAPGEWWYLRSSDLSNRAFQFGSSTDKIVPADFTGDGKTDLAFWRESTGEWFILRSEDSDFYSFPFGTSGDIPVSSDFDGDGKADAAVFRPSNATWYILNSSGGTTITQFGVSEDIPVVEDYDGDGKADIAIFRPSVSQWWINKSSGGVIVYQFGADGDKPVPADFTGDGKADVAVWRPSSGEWFVLRSEDSSFYSAPFGTNGDIPVAGDYDGDGKADIAVFRPTNNVWFLQKSANGFSAVTFGITGDKPVPSAFVP